MSATGVLVAAIVYVDISVVASLCRRSAGLFIAGKRCAVLSSQTKHEQIACHQDPCSATAFGSF